MSAWLERLMTWINGYTKAEHLHANNILSYQLQGMRPTKEQWALVVKVLRGGPRRFSRRVWRAVMKGFSHA
jgi:hypothetical protein